MAKIDLYSQEAKKVGSLDLKDEIFAIEPNNQAMFDAVLVYRASQRQGTHSTKGRSDVRGGGKKPWRQKGSGRARQGSIRAPQWRGGGVVFGPTPEKNYKLKMNKKVRRLAMKSAYSVVCRDKKFFALDKLSFNEPKTKDFIAFLKAFEVEGKTLVVVAPDSETDNVFLSGRNVAKVKVADCASINVEDLLHYDNVLMTEEAIKIVEEVLA
ncbi:MAG: 50S ribosomal protein L4 [Bacilli bacterium]|jgi:large subunit ribosomal protein L4|nr:50S ribosomal protein L4 [Bacilli bacterium]